MLTDNKACFDRDTQVRKSTDIFEHGRDGIGFSAIADSPLHRQASRVQSISTDLMGVIQTSSGGRKEPATWSTGALDP